MTIKLLFNYKNLDQKLRQIKLLQTLFGLGLKEAKYAVVRIYRIYFLRISQNVYL